MLLIGAAGLQVMNTVLHETSTSEFCNACHSHTNHTMEEHAILSHYQNKTGVRAECHSCYLPSMEDEWFDVRWMIMDGETSRILKVHESVYSDTTVPNDYGDIAAAMSRTAASFAIDIASEIGKLEAARR